jgi:hypothetical protein
MEDTRLEPCAWPVKLNIIKLLKSRHKISSPLYKDHLIIVRVLLNGGIYLDLCSWYRVKIK